jgi:hypothetical protein
LQFVVITLVANKQIAASETTGGALATPTVVHFGAVLLLLFVGIHNVWDSVVYIQSESFYAQFSAKSIPSKI